MNEIPQELPANERDPQISFLVFLPGKTVLLFSGLRVLCVCCPMFLVQSESRKALVTLYLYLFLMYL